jgi:hypothetical protein
VLELRTIVSPLRDLTKAGTDNLSKALSLAYRVFTRISNTEFAPSTISFVASTLQFSAPDPTL